MCALVAARLRKRESVSSIERSAICCCEILHCWISDERSSIRDDNPASTWFIRSVPCAVKVECACGYPWTDLGENFKISVHIEADKVSIWLLIMLSLDSSIDFGVNRVNCSAIEIPEAVPHWIVVCVLLDAPPNVIVISGIKIESFYIRCPVVAWRRKKM